MGHTRDKDLPLTWNAKDGTDILWKAPLIEAPGKAHLDHNQSSPVIIGDRIFVAYSYWPEGKTNKEIATSLNLSVYTVEAHRGRVMEKLNLHSTGELVRFALRNGMID